MNQHGLDDDLDPKKELNEVEDSLEYKLNQMGSKLDLIDQKLDRLAENVANKLSIRLGGLYFVSVAFLISYFTYINR